MYLLNLEFETQIRLQTFCRNLHHKSRKYVNSVYLIYMQVKEISETKVEQCKSFFFWFFYRIRNKLQFFEFKLKIYTWIRWEQADYDFFLPWRHYIVKNMIETEIQLRLEVQV